MPGPKFHETKRGRRFIDGTVPKLAQQVERLADALEEHNELKRKELDEHGSEHDAG